ncbi:MAG: diguanylate cyclase, partial [Solirubrobacteraceae bacterium]|nr:diguanylate cyclase [Solirubrobacteraceae bacterium]
RSTLALGIGCAIAHELLFGSVVPDGPSISGLPAWATMPVFGIAFAGIAVLLTIPWAANQRHRKLLRRQRALIDDQLAVSEIVIAVDRAGLVTLVSDHGLMVLGRSREAVIGADFFDLVVPADRLEAAREGHRRLIEAGDQLAAPAFYEFEHAIVAGDGRRRIFLWRVTVSMDGDEPVGTVASGFDITEVRRAQRQLLREQKDLVQLQQLARAVARESDAREAVVAGIQALVDGSLAVLMEPTPDGSALVITQSTRLDMIGKQAPLDGSPSGAVAAYRSGEPLFITDASTHPLVNQGLRQAAEVQTILYQPVLDADGEVIAVISLGWSNLLTELGERRTRLVELAAEEATSALQRLAAMRRWEEAAMTDALTGVPNRRSFDHLFEAALKTALVDEQPVAVALMDLNSFKILNDTEGHAAGDRVLKESASLWLRELRPTDVLARLGGDEFAVILPKCGLDNMDSVAGRLRQALRHEAGCGVGIAVWDRNETASELLHRADEELYTDKASRARDRIADVDRLEAVEATRLLDQPTDPELDALTEMVTALVGVPRATVTLVTGDRQFFASQCGVAGRSDDPTAAETPLSHSFCKHPATTGRELIVEDARVHPILKDNLATTEVGLVAYAGIPLVAGGETFGVLCAIDDKPRLWTLDELGALRSIARRATDLIAAKAST